MTSLRSKLQNYTELEILITTAFLLKYILVMTLDGINKMIVQGDV